MTDLLCFPNKNLWVKTHESLSKNSKNEQNWGNRLLKSWQKIIIFCIGLRGRKAIKRREKLRSRCRNLRILKGDSSLLSSKVNRDPRNRVRCILGLRLLERIEGIKRNLKGRKLGQNLAIPSTETPENSTQSLSTSRKSVPNFAKNPTTNGENP